MKRCAGVESRESDVLRQTNGHRYRCPLARARDKPTDSLAIQRLQFWNRS